MLVSNLPSFNSWFRSSQFSTEELGSEENQDLYLPFSNFHWMNSGGVACTVSAVAKSGRNLEHTFFHYPLYAKRAGYILVVYKFLYVHRCGDKLERDYREWLQSEYCSINSMCSNILHVDCVSDDGDAYFNLTFIENIPQDFVDRLRVRTDSYARFGRWFGIDGQPSTANCFPPEACALRRIQDLAEPYRNMFAKAVRVTSEFFSLNIDLAHRLSQGPFRAHVTSRCEAGFVKYSMFISKILFSEKSKAIVDLCVPCPRGAVQLDEVCVLCPPGTFQPFPGQTHCIRCNIGSPMTYAGASHVSECASTTLEPVSDFPSACFYHFMDMESDWSEFEDNDSSFSRRTQTQSRGFQSLASKLTRAFDVAGSAFDTIGDERLERKLRRRQQHHRDIVFKQHLDNAAEDFGIG